MGEGLIRSKTVHEDLFFRDHCFGALSSFFSKFWSRRGAIVLMSTCFYVKLVKFRLKFKKIVGLWSCWKNNEILFDYLFHAKSFISEHFLSHDKAGVKMI